MTLLIAYLIIGALYPAAGFWEHVGIFVLWLARMAWYNPRG